MFLECMKETHNLEKGSQEGRSREGTVATVGWDMNGEGGTSRQTWHGKG